MFKLSRITFLLLFTISLSVTAAENKSSPIGINTNEAMDIGTSIPFIDLFKLSLPFEEARPWLTKGKIKLNRTCKKVLSRGEAETALECNDDDPQGEVFILK